MWCNSPLYPEPAMAISSSFRNETNACQASVILPSAAQDGPWIQTMCPVTMHTPTSYLSPLPLNLWDINFSENFICTGMSVPSSVTNALLPQSPKYWLSHTIYKKYRTRFCLGTWLDKENKVAWIWILPLHIQGTIFHPQIVLTTLNISFCPFYPGCENCCFSFINCLEIQGPQQMLWINTCWHCFEWINFVPKHAANFKQCTKHWLPSPVERVISCFRKVYHACPCIDDDLGGICRHDCAVIAMLLLASKKIMGWVKNWVMISEGSKLCWQNLTAEGTTFSFFMLFSHDLHFKLQCCWHSQQQDCSFVISPWMTAHS